MWAIAKREATWDIVLQRSLGRGASGKEGDVWTRKVEWLTKMRCTFGSWLWL